MSFYTSKYVIYVVLKFYTGIWFNWACF